MPRKPSAETENRTLKRLLSEARAQMQAAKCDVMAYRQRATKAEQECAEWKRRFDLLLSKAGKMTADGDTE